MPWFRPVLSCTILCVALIASPPVAVLAQSAAPAHAAVEQNTAPTPLVAAPPTSPEVQADGTAIFRLMMPNAQKVELHLEGRHDPIPMTKGADGVWSVSVPSIAPQIYSYSFNVDGTSILDPHNTTIKTSFFSNDNVFLVPGHPAEPWETADVPHGVVHHALLPLRHRRY